MNHKKELLRSLWVGQKECSSANPDARTFCYLRLGTNSVQGPYDLNPKQLPN